MERSRSAVAASVLGTLLSLGYPLAVYFGLTRLSARAVGLCLLALALPLLALRLRGRRGAELRALLPVPVAVIGLLLLSAILDDGRFVLALPVLINLVFLLAFGGTLLGDTPMVERFARMQKPDLNEEERAYCRTVTWVWCAFFVLNGGVTAALAVLGPLSWWTLHTGLLSYLAMGALFGAEYVVRKARFREYGDSPQDRLLSALFPPPGADSAR